MSTKGNWSYFDSLEVITTQKCLNRFENNAEKWLSLIVLIIPLDPQSIFGWGLFHWKNRHLGLQFEYIFCLILTYIKWVIAVWSQTNPAIKIRVFGDACTYIHVHGPKISLFDVGQPLNPWEHAKTSKRPWKP